jgi:hypothetical protein
MSRKPAAKNATDVLQLLTAQHAEVGALFEKSSRRMSPITRTARKMFEQLMTGHPHKDVPNETRKAAPLPPAS